MNMRMKFPASFRIEIVPFLFTRHRESAPKKFSGSLHNDQEVIFVFILDRESGYLVILFAIVVGATVGMAQAASVDWKFYGGVSLDDGHSECFYDARGVAKGQDGHIRVWTKDLLQKDMDSIDIEKDFDGKILENTAQKVANYYVPPYAKVETIDANQSMAIIRYEETANVSDIQPRANIFYELNCSERMVRELSINVMANGKNDSRDKPGDWKYVPPEGNGASLLKILCPLQ